MYHPSPPLLLLFLLSLFIPFVALYPQSSSIKRYLYGNNPWKLEKTNIRLQSEHKNVQSMTAALNASTFTSHQIDDLVASLDGLNLYPLVNNVGSGVKI